MSRSIIHEFQNTSNIYCDAASPKPRQKPLLEQTLPKYRQQILQKVLQTNSRDRTSKIKQKYQDFGQHDFINKLKHNSTKQIDRKSVRAIQRYLHELKQQKMNSASFLNLTHSLLGFSQIQHSGIMNQNSQLSLVPATNLSNNSIRLQSAGIKTKSEQIVKNGFMRNYRPQRQQRMQSKLHYLQNIEQPTIYQSAKFNNYQTNLTGNNQNGSLQNLNKDFHFQGISFRNNYPQEQLQNDNLKEQGISRQLLTKPDKLSNMLRNSSQINFQHKNQSQKSRPRFDTAHKTAQQVIQEYPSYQQNLFQDLHSQLKAAQSRNRQQNQIIKLQQVMIDKLNIQLSKALQRMNKNEQKTIINEQYLLKRLKEQNHHNERQFYYQNMWEQNRHKLQHLQVFKMQIQEHTQQWQSKYQSLKEVLKQFCFQTQAESIATLRHTQHSGSMSDRYEDQQASQRQQQANQIQQQTNQSQKLIGHNQNLNLFCHIQN